MNDHWKSDSKINVIRYVTIHQTESKKWKLDIWANIRRRISDDPNNSDWNNIQSLFQKMFWQEIFDDFRISIKTYTHILHIYIP